VTPAAKVNAVSAADGAAAEADAPTKTEFDAVVALANANKAAVNAVIAALKAAGLMVSV
jgi:ribosomal protein L7/L12